MNDDPVQPDAVRPDPARRHLVLPEPVRPDPVRPDPVRLGPATVIELLVDGQPVAGLAGQSIAGVLLGAGRPTWRSSRGGRPRGVFCGIGVCHDCLITVNGVADVRACQRRATHGDVITTDDRPHATPPQAGRPPLAPGVETTPARPPIPHGATPARPPIPHGATPTRPPIPQGGEITPGRPALGRGDGSTTDEAR